MSSSALPRAKWIRIILRGGNWRTACGQRFERGEIGIARVKGFEIGAIVMGLGVVGPESDRAGITGGRLVELALVLLRAGQVVVGFGKVGPESDGLFVTGHGLGEPALRPQDVAKVIVGTGEAGLESDGPLAVEQRFVELIELAKQGTEIVVGLGQIGPQGQRLPKLSHGLAELALRQRTLPRLL